MSKILILKKNGEELTFDVIENIIEIAMLLNNETEKTAYMSKYEKFRNRPDFISLTLLKDNKKLVINRRYISCVYE